MNLWRMPLSDLEQPATGKPELVKKLDFGGFSYDRSTTLTGDFGNLTPGDDGTADHIIWHAQPNGGVLVWGVGGGTDTKPRLLHDLKTGGWAYASSVPLAGDVTGDGYDDLVVVHANRSAAKPHGYNVSVFENNRSGGLGAADLWFEGDLHFDEEKDQQRARYRLLPEPLRHLLPLARNRAVARARGWMVVHRLTPGRWRRKR